MSHQRRRPDSDKLEATEPEDWDGQRGRLADLATSPGPARDVYARFYKFLYDEDPEAYSGGSSP